MGKTKGILRCLLPWSYQDGQIGALGLAYSAELTYALSLGFTLNLWTDDLLWQNSWDETYSNHAKTTFGRNTTIEDTLLTDHYENFRGINANLGFLWDLNQYITVGGVVKTPFTADIDLSYSEDWAIRDANGNILYEGMISGSEKAELDMPLSVGFGVAARFSDSFSMGLDIYYTHWEDYTLTDGAGNEFSPIDAKLKGDSDVSNTTQVRLGAEYLFIGTDGKWVIPLRGGLFYDPEPAEGEVKDFSA